MWCGCSDGGVRAFSAIDAQYLHASMDHPSRVSCLCATPLSVSEGLDGSVQRDDHTTSGDGSNSGGNEYGWGQAVGYGRHGRRNHSDTNNNNDSDASHHDSKTHTKESIQKGLWSVCRGSRTIVRRDPKSGNIIQRLTGHQSSVLCMAVTFASFKDTDSAAAAMSRGGSRANSRRNSRRNSRSDINTNAVMDERDPNGSCIRLWTGAEDGIRVWSLSGHCLSILRNESSPASSRVGYLLSVPIAASVSGRSVARGDGAKGSRRRSVSYRIWSSGNDGIYIWDVDSAKVCNKIPSDRSMVSGCVMGTNAWCIDKHSTVSIWNTSTCDLRQSFTVSKTPVLCVQAVEVASSVWFGTDSAIVRYTDTADGQGSIRRPKKATLLHPAQHSNGSGLENIQTEQNHTASDDRKQTHIYTSASTHSNNNRDSHNNNNNADHDNDIDDSTYANTANNDSKDNTDSHSTFGQRLSASASEEALTREIRVQTRTIGDLLREKAELQRSVEVLTSKLILRASGRKEV